MVDRDLCQGHAVCESEAPGIFSVSKKGELTVVVETPPEDRRALVEAAVRECPTHALRIEELTLKATARPCGAPPDRDEGRD